MGGVFKYASILIFCIVFSEHRANCFPASSTTETILSAIKIPDDCICSFEYMPVCGNDDQTYANECLFDCAAATEEGKFRNLRISFRGECDGEPLPIQ